MGEGLQQDRTVMGRVAAFNAVVAKLDELEPVCFLSTGARPHACRPESFASDTFRRAAAPIVGAIENETEDACERVLLAANAVAKGGCHVSLRSVFTLAEQTLEKLNGRRAKTKGGECDQSFAEACRILTRGARPVMGRDIASEWFASSFWLACARGIVCEEMREKAILAIPAGSLMRRMAEDALLKHSDLPVKAPAKKKTPKADIAAAAVKKDGAGPKAKKGNVVPLLPPSERRVRREERVAAQL